MEKTAEERVEFVDQLLIKCANELGIEFIPEQTENTTSISNEAKDMAEVKEWLGSSIL